MLAKDAHAQATFKADDVLRGRVDAPRLIARRGGVMAAVFDYTIDGSILVQALRGVSF